MVTISISPNQVDLLLEDYNHIADQSIQYVTLSPCDIISPGLTLQSTFNYTQCTGPPSYHTSFIYHTGEPHSSLPKASLTTDDKCNGDSIDVQGNIMADSKCKAISSVKSIKPGSKEDADGKYCLLNSREEDCRCIA